MEALTALTDLRSLLMAQQPSEDTSPGSENQWRGMHIHTHIYKCTHIYTPYIYTHIYTCMHINTHIHTHLTRL